MKSNGAVSRLRVEHMNAPLGLHATRPRLSWEFSGEWRGARPVAAEVRAGTRPERVARGRADLWNSGVLEGDAATQTVWGGDPLGSRQPVHWQVRVRDEKGRWTDWSAVERFELGLLKRSDWSGQWVGGDRVGGPRTPAAAPYLRREFGVGEGLASARLHVTALGAYEFSLNGVVVGDEVLSPGWTDFRKRVACQMHDVTALLRPGVNCAGAILGDGWYCGHLEWRDRQLYGEKPLLLAQLELSYEDGRTEVVATGPEWAFAYGPILENDLIMGEVYDARREFPGWNAAGFDAGSWRPALVAQDPGIELSARLGPPVRRQAELKPVAPVKVQPQWPLARYVYDLGQNMVGWARLRLEAPAGTTVRVRYAEVLDANGGIYTANLRSARATDYYTCRGGGVEVWEPRFTFHGFRYVELFGLKEAPAADAVTGIVLHSEMEPTGAFSCSDPLLNQLQHNIEWGLRGNFLEVPTDCPQRDERLGWTGDAQVFIRTAAFNRDVAAFFTKWQRDIADAQRPSGNVPATVPDSGLPFQDSDGGPAWADAVLICPWTVHHCFVDDALLAEHYGSFKAFLESIERRAKDHIRCHPDVDTWGGFGDWLALDGSGKTDGGTPKDLIGTAFFAHGADLLSRIAARLGKKADAARFAKLAGRVRAAFRRRYVTDDGLVAGGTQTSMVLALHFGMVEEELRPRILSELVRDIEKRGNKLATGFVGTSYLPFVLSDGGRPDIAYRLLHQKNWPSWLYAVTQGATTIWERWDGWTHDQGFAGAGMNSFNHYAYGAIGDWMYRRVAGLDSDPAVPGYRRLVIRPLPHGSGLSEAQASLRTPLGTARSAWRLEGLQFDLEVTVPPGATAEVRLPATSGAEVTEGGRPVAKAAGVGGVAREATLAVVEVSSGSYAFRVVEPVPART